VALNVKKRHFIATNEENHSHFAYKPHLTDISREKRLTTQVVTLALNRWRSTRYFTPRFINPKQHRSIPPLPDTFTLARTLQNNLRYMILPDLTILPETATSEGSTPYTLGPSRRLMNWPACSIINIERQTLFKLKLSIKSLIKPISFCLNILYLPSWNVKRHYFGFITIDRDWVAARMPNNCSIKKIGILHRLEVDFAVASFTITYIRNTVIDFTHAYYEEPTTILIPPPQETDKLFTFLEPFSWQVWVLLVATVVVVGILLWLMMLVPHIPMMYPFDQPQYQRRKQQSLYRYLWDTATALFTQSHLMQENEPGRILHGVWWMISVILIYTYNGTLISFLTVPRLEALIDSLEDLAGQREVLWTFRHATSHDSLFKNAEPPSTYHKIGLLIKESPHLKVTSDAEGVAAVLEKNMAFIKEQRHMCFDTIFVRTKEIRIGQVPQLFFSAGFGWVVPERSPYLRLFNAEILKMSQLGLFSVWYRQYWPKPNECTHGR
ncbi:unnamed protein product, partial [Meganyctiphanes norvegica]